VAFWHEFASYVDVYKPLITLISTYPSSKAKELSRNLKENGFSSTYSRRLHGPPKTLQ